jgi:hypothetical protein
MEAKTENPITTELAKQNVTEAVIAQLKRDFLPLKINGIDDKDGYKKVHDARIVCRDHRTLTEKICKKGREDAVKIQKDWIAKEKEVVAQISEIEQYLKKQEDAIDEQKEAIQIRAERLLKLPGRKAQVIGLESELTVMDDAFILTQTDQEWDALISAAKEINLKKREEKLAAEQKKIDDAKALEVEKRTVERVNQLTSIGATMKHTGRGVVYSKGTEEIIEKMVKECFDEEWPKIVEVFEKAVIPPKPESAPAFRPAPPASQPVIKEVSDEEKLFRYASALESVSTPDVKTSEGIEVLKNANKLINEAINLLRK